MARRVQSLIAKGLTVLLFSLLILSFAIWGVGDMVTGSHTAEVVVKVGDVEITQDRFSRNLVAETNRLGQALGTRIDGQQAQSFGIVSQVLSRMISRALLDQQASDLGLLVTDDQIRQQILDEAAFKDERGAFDRNRFIQALRISGLSEATYVDSLRNDIQRRQITGPIAGAVTAPTALAELLHRHQAEQRIARYFVMEAASVGAIDPPDEATLEAFLADNQSNFMAPAYRAITLVQLRPQDIASEMSIAEDEVRAAFEAQRENFAIPERRALVQMVFGDLETAQTAVNRLKAGEGFGAVAEDLTGRPAADLGSVSRDEVLPELAEGAFALSVNEIGGPLQSVLGWHVITVTEIVAGEEPDFDQIRDELADDLALSAAIDSTISIANQFDDSLASGASLEEAANAAALSVRIIEAIDRQGNDPDGQAIDGLPSGGEFLQTVFATESGEATLLTETPDGGYFIARIDGLTPATPRPFAEVREAVLELWTNTERTSRLRARAQELVERVNTGTLMTDVASGEGLELMTSEALTRFDSATPPSPAPDLAGWLFQIEMEEAVAVPSEAGYLVAQLTEIVVPEVTADPDALARTREQVTGRLRDDLLAQYLQALQEIYPATVNQAAIDQTLETF